MKRLLRGINTSRLLLRLRENGGLARIADEFINQLDEVAQMLESIERFLTKER